HANAGEPDGNGKREFDSPQNLSRTHAHATTGLDDELIHLLDSDDCVAQDWKHCVEDQSDDSHLEPHAEKQCEQHEHSDRGDGLPSIGNGENPGAKPPCPTSTEEDAQGHSETHDDDG